MESNDKPQPGGRPLRIAVVGPCASGKSTLADALLEAGYEVRQPAQEHSYVPSMWQKVTRPDLLIYLDVDRKSIRKRSPHLDAVTQRLAEQHQRLSHAREYCDYYLDTSDLTATEVRQRVIAFLQEAVQRAG